MINLSKSLAKTTRLIKKNKKIFFLALLLQLIFLIAFFSITTHYQIKVMEDSKGIIEPLQGANYNPEDLEKGKPFVKDIIGINQKFKSIKKNINLLLTWSILIFMILNGLLWIIVYKLIGIKKNNLKMWLKFVVSSLIFFLILLSSTYFIFSKSLISDDMTLSLQTNSRIIIILFSILYYLLLVSFSFIDAPSWKKFSKSVYETGLKKIYLTILPLIIILSLIFGAVYFMQYAITNATLVLLILSSLLLIFVLTTTKIFWIISLKSISKKI